MTRTPLYHALCRDPVTVQASLFTPVCGWCVWVVCVGGVLVVLFCWLVLVLLVLVGWLARVLLVLAGCVV